jgi:hypothetical protein
MKIIILSTIILISSCTTGSLFLQPQDAPDPLSSKDYADFLAATSKDFLNFEETKTVNLKTESVTYLENIYERLVTNNQVVLNNPEKASFHFVKSKTPFLFSLPGSQFFFSTALLERHLKSEGLFVAAFAAEVLRSQRLIYEKKILIPLGFYNSEKMINLTRLKLGTKQKVNEWTYFILKRSGYDSSAYLNWIQVQSRNTLDFSVFILDPVSLSKEEQLFKNFISKQGFLNIEKKLSESNSSKEFYKLLSNIAGQ